MRSTGENECLLIESETSADYWDTDMERPCQIRSLLRSRSRVETQQRWQSRRLSRRLITLIFAGRNRTIMIRRELPRTTGAGRARRPAA